MKKLFTLLFSAISLFALSQSTPTWQQTINAGANPSVTRNTSLTTTGTFGVKSTGALKFLTSATGSLFSYKRIATSDSSYLSLINAGTGTAFRLYSIGDNPTTIAGNGFAGTLNLSVAGVLGQSSSLQLTTTGATTISASGITNPAIILIIDTIGGVKYNQDYSANFTARSLIDSGFAAATFAPISASSLTLANVMDNGNIVGAGGAILNGAGQPSINVTNRELLDLNDDISITWHDRKLASSSPAYTLDWEISQLLGAWTLQTTLNKYTFLTPATSATLSIANAKALYVANTFTFTGTDAKEFSFPATSDAVATLTVTQTFTNKTLTTPTISGTGFTNANHAHLDATSGGVITMASVSDLPLLASGTYTPSITLGANVTGGGGATAFKMQYMRVGNTVTVSGYANVDIITTLLVSTIELSLPFASDFVTIGECDGGGASEDTGTFKPLRVSANPTTNLCSVTVFGQAGTGNTSWFFSFTYLII